MGWIKDFFDIVIEPTVSDYKELKASVKVDNIKFKNDVKDMIRESSPPIGQAVDTIDKVSSVTRNFVNAIDPISIVGREFNFNQSFSKGDHLYVQRMPYTHHGIYLGDERVIHYANGTVEIVSMDEFAKGATVNKKDSPCSFSANTIISRATSRLGEGDYSLFVNNCEHFCHWCRNGDYKNNY